MNPAGTAERNADLARIHIAKKQLGLDDDTYRDMLFSIGRVRSAGDLDFAGRRRVLEHLASRGFKSTAKRAAPATGWEWVNNAAEDKKPMLRKVAVMLRDAGRGKEYVDGIAKKMCHVERVEFCTPKQLHDVVSALVKDQQRRARAAMGA
jgi:phage gp16-like protein